MRVLGTVGSMLWLIEATTIITGAMSRGDTHEAACDELYAAAQALVGDVGAAA